MLLFCTIRNANFYYRFGTASNYDVAQGVSHITFGKKKTFFFSILCGIRGALYFQMFCPHNGTALPP